MVLVSTVIMFHFQKLTLKYFVTVFPLSAPACSREDALRDCIFLVQLGRVDVFDLSNFTRNFPQYENGSGLH